MLLPSHYLSPFQTKIMSDPLSGISGHPKLQARQIPDVNATDCQIAAGYYHTLGWWPGVFGSVVWVVASHPVEALDVPPELGRRAVDLLCARGALGPVFQTAPGTQARWVLLTGRRDSGWYTLAPRLAELGVEHMWAGATLDLPPSEVAGECLTWLIPPVGRNVPTFASVARAVIDAAAG